MSDPLLTIAIPTYNRAAKLKVQIERLLPQMCPEIQLCVYDNASTDETREVVQSLSKGHQIQYSCVPANCGAGRNIFRCLEGCQTEWVWILGDDDPVSMTAIKRLLPTLREQTCDFIHFSTRETVHREDEVVTDINTLLNKNTFSSLLWISAGVYRKPSFSKYFFLYNESISTWAPHLIMVLAMIESGLGKVLLSSDELLERAPFVPCSWSSIACIVRNSLCPEFLSRFESRKALATSILSQWYYSTIFTGLSYIANANDTKAWKRIRKQAYSNLRLYGAPSIFYYCITRCLRRGCRKESLRLIKRHIIAGFLEYLPSYLFIPIAARLASSRQ